MSELQVKTFGPFKMPKPFANELRIGNWVSHFYVLATDKIEAPELKKVQVDADLLKHISDNGMLACYRGIPLTPEILEKAGFEKRTFSFYDFFTKRYIHVNVESRVELQHIDNGLFAWIEGNTNVHLRYVHQLQNLYFALTGTELTIDL